MTNTETKTETVIVCYSEFSDPNFDDTFKQVTFDGTKADFIKQWIATYDNHPYATMTESDLEHVTICSNTDVWKQLKTLDAFYDIPNFNEIFSGTEDLYADFLDHHFTEITKVNWKQ